MHVSLCAFCFQVIEVDHMLYHILSPVLGYRLLAKSMEGIYNLVIHVHVRP